MYDGLLKHKKENIMIDYKNIPSFPTAIDEKKFNLDIKILESRFHSLKVVAVISGIAAVALAILANNFVATFGINLIIGATYLSVAAYMIWIEDELIRNPIMLLPILPAVLFPKAAGLIIIFVASAFFTHMKIYNWRLHADANALDQLAVKGFMGRDENDPTPPLFCDWIIRRPEAVKQLLKNPDVNLTIKYRKYNNLFQMAVDTNLGIPQVCNLLWEKASFEDKKFVLYVGINKNMPIIDIFRINNLKIRSQKDNEVSICQQFIFFANSFSNESLLEPLPTEVKAYILYLWKLQFTNNGNQEKHSEFEPELMHIVNYISKYSKLI
jgi:hypothetical protein